MTEEMQDKPWERAGYSLHEWVQLSPQVRQQKEREFPFVAKDRERRPFIIDDVSDINKTSKRLRDEDDGIIQPIVDVNVKKNNNNENTGIVVEEFLFIKRREEEIKIERDRFFEMNQKIEIHKNKLNNNTQDDDEVFESYMYGI